MVKNKKLFCLEPGSANVVHIDPELWNEDCGADIAERRCFNMFVAL